MLVLSAYSTHRATNVNDDPLLTPKEVADELRIDVRAVYRLLRKGELRHLDLGYRTKRIKRTQLDEYIKTRVTG